MKSGLKGILFSISKRVIFNGIIRKKILLNAILSFGYIEIEKKWYHAPWGEANKKSGVVQSIIICEIDITLVTVKKNMMKSQSFFF